MIFPCLTPSPPHSILQEFTSLLSNVSVHVSKCKDVFIDTFLIAAKSHSRAADSPGVIVTDESGKEAPGFVPPHPETSQGKDQDAAPWRRPGSLRARPTNSGKLSPSSDDLVTVRRAHSFGSDEK